MSEKAYYQLRSPNGETFIVSLSEPERDTLEEPTFSQKLLPHLSSIARKLFGKVKHAEGARK